MSETLRKRLAATLSVAAGERAVVARISTASIDRDGEVLLPQGCDASEFLRSPTVFYNHDYDLPIGRCAGLTRHADCLEAKTIFATRPDGHEGVWLPDVVLSLLQQGVINGFSVGFHPLEGRRPTARDRALFGPGVRYVHSKWKLLEYSVAPLPANQDALALAVSKAQVTRAQAARLCPPVEFPAPMPRRQVLLVTRSGSRCQPSAAQQITDALHKAKGRLYAS